ncbi:DUF6480 family protein [Streptomyces sp. AF1A]|uniref:DUF6480 family protein n=1 Tax=Streptomyces sp. AF1A TaxID=3394350 RepID=UPI0039BC307B
MNPDPEPERTIGPERGGSEPSGEAPPATNGMPETGCREPHVRSRGCATGATTRIVVLVVSVAACFLAYAWP